MAPHFETIDERTAGELMQEAREQVLRAGARPGTPLGRALETLAVTLTERHADGDAGRAPGPAACGSCAAGRRSGDDLEALVAPSTAALGAEPGLEPRGSEERGLRRRPVRRRRPAGRGQRAGQGLGKDCERGRLILTWLNGSTATGVRLLVEYKRCFLKADGGALRRWRRRR